MISLRLEKFFNGVWNLYQNFHMVTALVLGFGIFILIWIWSPVIDTIFPQCVSLSWFWMYKEHLCPFSPNLGFRGCWRFLTVVWHLDLDSDIVTGLWYSPVQNFVSLSWFLKCKEHLCLLSPDYGLWRMLEVPDWSLALRSWLGFCQWCFIHPCFEFCRSILILKMQRTPISFKS